MTRRLLASPATCSRVILVALMLSLAAAQAQAQSKLITAEPSFKADPPITIKQVSLAGKPVKLGVPFSGGDNWLDGLSIEVENTSAKSVVYLEVVLSFAHVK